MNIQKYVASFSTQLGLVVGMLMYISYGLAHQAFQNLGLMMLCAFIGCFIPYYSRFSNKIEEIVNLRSARVSYGRIARFLPQLIFNIGIFLVLTIAEIFPTSNLNALGGVLGIAVVTTCASQGMQYLALLMANREIGERNRNVLIALSVNIVVTAIATLGWLWAKTAFLVLGLGFGTFFFILGFLSDWRAVSYRRGGIGVFFGTFNPIHSTHLALIHDAIEQRGLEKVYLHCTAIPKLHAQALQRGEIHISRYERGMRVYETTDKADVHANYFPTGRMFYEYEDRLAMMRAAIMDANLAEKVEVLSLPQLYEQGGFYAVLACIKKLHQGSAIHGIHGSDLGGMWVRGIYDESGWIYPYPVVRRDKVSATAIRNGATQLTTKRVQHLMTTLQNTSKSALSA
jgi:nicotinic acid mononucleotide adenylyltransferase